MRDLRNMLWCDLKTDAEKAEFLRSGRAWETGIISMDLALEVADIFEERSNNKSVTGIGAQNTAHNR